MVKPSGISSFIDYDQHVDENTRFLYYSYGHEHEKLNTTNGKLDKIASSSIES